MAGSVGGSEKFVSPPARAVQSVRLPIVLAEKVMQNVSRFEANLLRLLYYFLRREPIERALPLIEARCEAPQSLGPGAVRLVQDALAKGSTFLLAQRGGWRDEPYLRNLKKKDGRLWQRTPPAMLGLRFSQASLRFL